MTTTDLAALLKGLAERVTPGPWDFIMEGDWPMVISSAIDPEDGHRLPIIDLCHGGYEHEGYEHSNVATGQLIAALRTNLATIIAALEQGEEGERMAKLLKIRTRQVEQCSSGWSKAARKALAGDSRDLRLRLALHDAPPVEVVLSDKDQTDAG